MADMRKYENICNGRDTSVMPHHSCLLQRHAKTKVLNNKIDKNEYPDSNQNNEEQRRNREKTTKQEIDETANNFTNKQQCIPYGVYSHSMSISFSCAHTNL